MSVEERARAAGQQTVAIFETSTDVVLDYGTLMDRRRSQRRNRTLTLAAAVVVAAFAVLVAQNTLTADSTPQPMKPAPGLEIGAVPVWYDDAGLHRGDLVEQTPVELRQSDELGVDGALALVRTGAVYSDPATGDVWFHPWGGDPRIVGHNSWEGPGADPNGDIAAWFEGSELVIYDTAEGREVSRTTQSQAVADCNSLCAEHFQGNRFLRVSDVRVVWAGGPSGDRTHSHDVATGKTSTNLQEDVPGPNPGLPFVLGVPGRAGEAYADLEVGRPSFSGAYVLGVEPGEEHLAVIVNTKNAELWRISKSTDPHVAWSYGDIALVSTDSDFLACDPTSRMCETLSVGGPILMPTN